MTDEQGRMSQDGSSLQRVTFKVRSTKSRRSSTKKALRKFMGKVQLLGQRGSWEVFVQDVALVDDSLSTLTTVVQGADRIESVRDADRDECVPTLRGSRLFDLAEDDEEEGGSCTAASPEKSALLDSAASGPAAYTKMYMGAVAKVRMRNSTRLKRPSSEPAFFSGITTEHRSDTERGLLEKSSLHRCGDVALLRLHRSDPRWQIMRFFNDVAQESAVDLEDINFAFSPEVFSSLLGSFSSASAFTVWRPTSIEAIRKMILGKGVGKGLDIKGKSAKEGKLSGFVPFVQIHEEEDKARVLDLLEEETEEGRLGPMDPNHALRVFFRTREMRDAAVRELGRVAKETMAAGGGVRYKTANIDAYSPACFGLEVPEPLFWEGYVARRDIRRASPDLVTGRDSMPEFQVLNFLAMRKHDKPVAGSGRGNKRRAVIWQFADSLSEVMCPQHLLVAYEESGKVMPVVSDFDCFLMGTRGVKYKDPLSEEQKGAMEWCVSEIEKIVEHPYPINESVWMKRWCNVLAKTDYHPEIPEYGFGDPKSYGIMKAAASRLKGTGAVRHGPESFNFHFPQALDEKFLVISPEYFEGNVQWKEMNVRELQDFLIEQVTERGFTFPLNPKWILVNEGWKRVYDCLCSADNEEIQQSLNTWNLSETGLKKRIEDIFERRASLVSKRRAMLQNTKWYSPEVSPEERELIGSRAQIKLWSKRRSRAE